MTPEPPASPDGSSLPQRHRPSLGNLAKDTTEMDLWNFDGDLEVPGEIEEPAASATPPTFSRVIPTPRTPQSPKPREMHDRPAFKPPAVEELIQMNVNKEAIKSRPTGSTGREARSVSEFDDDLEHWDDAEFVPEIDDLPAMKIPEIIQSEPSQPEPNPEKAVKAQIKPEKTVQAPTQVETDDEFTPVPRENAVPISLRPHMGLSKIERIGLIALLVILLGGGAAIFLSSLRPLAVSSIKAEAADFPIRGSKVTITSAKSYWRAPIKDGAEADTFRRGTVLLPVIEMVVAGGPADIRIFFRDEEGRTVGDAITRNITGDATLKIAATAGFDDPGMHAAYRTGESKPWTIEVRETPVGAVSDGESTKLFEMNISTDRH